VGLRQSGMIPRPTGQALIQDTRASATQRRQVLIRLRSSAVADDLRSGQAFGSAETRFAQDDTALVVVGQADRMRAMSEGIYFTYIVASRSRTLYVGVTGDLRKRVFEHKQKLHEGFSATYNCDRLVWFERLAEVDHAIEREKQLKGWRREKKIALIEVNNPTWVDLSEGWYTPEQLA
jgi:putative endonuclease